MNARRCVLLLSATLTATYGRQLPERPGKALVQKTCSGCHAADIVAGEDKTRDQWADTVNKMMGMGAQMTEDDFNDILDYLSTNFPPKIRVNRATAERIAAGLDLTAKEAEDIVRYRQQHGSFRSFDDLLKVPGLDARKMAERKKLIAF